MNKQRQLDDFFGLQTPEEESKPNKHADLKDILFKKITLRSKLKILPKVLSKKERYLILVFVLLILGSIISIPIATYFHFTKAVAASGGSITEGIIGEPRHINPLLAQSDTDRDLVRLIYSGLLKYNEKGKLVPDLAKSYEISQDELSYTVYLKDNVLWHDNSPVTADDIIFTIQLAQNSDYGSLQRINWQGVEVERADEKTIVFKLKNKYAQFLTNLTLPIIPQHVWENIKPINFALSELNLKPVGSGPYLFKKLQKDKSGKVFMYRLEANKNFYSQRPMIEEIEIKFYESEDALIEGYNKNEIESLGFISSQNLDKLKFKQRIVVERITMPRYFSVFFNQNQSKELSDKNVRLALAYATDKNSLIEKILDGNGIVVDSPMIGEVLGVNEDVKKYEYNKDTANQLLLKAGWELRDNESIRTKKPSATGRASSSGGDDKLTIKLTTSTWPELIEVAQLLKEQWKEVGVEIEVEALPTPDLQQVIKDRNYQMLLFGEILSLDPDPFTLWHSSQKRDPGLNLTLYGSKETDTLLEDARKTLNPSERIKKYQDFQKLIVEEVPALFLYSPYYLYAHTKRINGFANKIIATPSDRFFNIENWYINTRRVWQ
ncbi:MAG: hypothetical protein HYT62_05240 [Candidatus Yanofskybacteria bacterium]|nr:hypothetical protein [Candidatus Yanofskybacteria bacterium]